jgi:hypothetical protein
MIAMRHGVAAGARDGRAGGHGGELRRRPAERGTGFVFTWEQSNALGRRPLPDTYWNKQDAGTDAEARRRRI